MAGKVISIIATSDPEKARTGVMYTMRALQEGWLEDVKLIFFGPGEHVLLEDEAVQKMVKRIQEAETPMACKFLSDRDNTSEQIEELGVEVVYVGSIISDLISRGYTPMVW